MTSWVEKHGDALIVIAVVIGSFAASVAILDQRLDAQDNLIAQPFGAVAQRFDAGDQRFDAMDNGVDRLADEVSELRKITVSISERVSRNEGRIDVILDQMRVTDTPSP